MMFSKVIGFVFAMETIFSPSRAHIEVCHRDKQRPAPLRFARRPSQLQKSSTVIKFLVPDHLVACIILVPGLSHFFVWRKCQTSKLCELRSPALAWSIIRTSSPKSWGSTGTKG